MTVPLPDAYPSSPFIHHLHAADRVIYCAAPLFSPHARIAAEALATTVELHVAAALAASDQRPSSHGHVFLPYRDSDQTALSGADRAKVIFQRDIEALSQSAGLLALFDGSPKDSGVAMEIGFMRGLNRPASLLTTDFLADCWHPTGILSAVDPVISQLAHSTHVVSAWPRVRSYTHSHYHHMQGALDTFVAHCLASFPVVCSPLARPERRSPRNVYLDFFGARFAWARYEADSLAAILTNEGLSVRTARRYDPRIGVTSLLERAADDLNALLSAEVAVFSADGMEMDAGSAALLGLAAACHIPIVMQYTSLLELGSLTGQRMKVNLMLEQAATHVTATAPETVAQVAHLALL